jgi:SAM-dependent methyltransferase
VTDYLDLEAALATSFVHPGGKAATRLLLGDLGLGPGSSALDVGCGTGASAEHAARAGARVTGVDLRPAMLAAARRRAPTPDLVRTDLCRGLPFADAAFDAVWAESVVALLEPRLVVREMVRVVRPGGRVALNERIWRRGTPMSDAARINALSMRCFGIPAAASDPLDRDRWTALLADCGLEVVRVTAVADLESRPPPLPWRERLDRQRRYLSSPGRLARSLRWRWLIRRHRHDWARLESWIFEAVRP